MNTAVVKKVLNLSYGEQKRIFSQSSDRFTKDAFPTRRARSSLLFGHSRDFKNVETFNLNSGYRLSRSAGKIYVSIETKDPPPTQKLPPRKLSLEEMEALVSDLREQIDLLSTYLQEERLRHGGTKKRAIADLVQQKSELNHRHDQEMYNLRQFHNDEKQLLQSQHEAKLNQSEKEHEHKMEKTQAEYRMLQASFKIYRSTVQDEMQNELKLKKAEFDWEKKRCVENAVDECRKNMEENFSREREEIRKEFLQNMNQLMKEHRDELDQMAKKTKSEDEIKDLIKRSKQLDAAMEDIEKLKEDLAESGKKNRVLASDLKEIKKNLATLELQFDDKVQGVEDKHRYFIETLRREKADVTRRLVRSCEEFQVEKIAREVAEKERREAAVKLLQKKLQAVDKDINKLDSVLDGRISATLTDQVEVIANILQRMEGVNLPAVLTDFIAILKKFQKKQRFVSLSSPNLIDGKTKVDDLRQRRRSSGLARQVKTAGSSERRLMSDRQRKSSAPSSKSFEPEPGIPQSREVRKLSRRDSLSDNSSLWDSESFKSYIMEAVVDQVDSNLDVDKVRDSIGNLIFSTVKQQWDELSLHEKVGKVLVNNVNSSTELDNLKTLCSDVLLNETVQGWNVESLKPSIGYRILNEVSRHFAEDSLHTKVFTVICTDEKLAILSVSTKNEVTDIILSATSNISKHDSVKTRFGDYFTEDVRLRVDDPSLKRNLTGAVSDDVVLKLVNDILGDSGSQNGVPDSLNEQTPVFSYKRMADSSTIEENVPSPDEKVVKSGVDEKQQSKKQSISEEKLLKLGIADAVSQDIITRLNKDALLSKIAKGVAEEVKRIWSDENFRRRMSNAVLNDTKTSDENAAHDSSRKTAVDNANVHYDGKEMRRSSSSASNSTASVKKDSKRSAVLSPGVRDTEGLNTHDKATTSTDQKELKRRSSNAGFSSAINDSQNAKAHDKIAKSTEQQELKHRSSSSVYSPAINDSQNAKTLDKVIKSTDQQILKRRSSSSVYSPAINDSPNVNAHDKIAKSTDQQELKHRSSSTVYSPAINDSQNAKTLDKAIKSTDQQILKRRSSNAGFGPAINDSSNAKAHDKVTKSTDQQELKHQSRSAVSHPKAYDSDGLKTLGIKTETAEKEASFSPIPNAPPSPREVTPSQIMLEVSPSLNIQDITGSRHSFEGNFERNRFQAVSEPRSPKARFSKKPSTRGKKSPRTSAKHKKKSYSVLNGSDNEEELQFMSGEDQVESPSPESIASPAYFEGKLKDLSPVRVFVDGQPLDADNDDDEVARWRGTFLGRDDRTRPPVIFDVEAYKALTATTPDSSTISQKSNVLEHPLGVKAGSQSASPSRSPSPDP